MIAEFSAYHFYPLLHWRHSLGVLLGDGNVLLLALLRQINHVTREERFSMFLKVFLIGIKHSIKPWKKLLSTVVGVENDWHTIGWRNCTNVVGSSNSTVDGGKLTIVRNTLPCVSLITNKVLQVVLPFLQSMQHHLERFGGLLVICCHGRPPELRRLSRKM